MSNEAKDLYKTPEYKNFISAAKAFDSIRNASPHWRQVDPAGFAASRAKCEDKYEAAKADWYQVAGL